MSPGLRKSKQNNLGIHKQFEAYIIQASYESFVTSI